MDMVGWRGPAELVRIKGGEAIVDLGGKARKVPVETVRPFDFKAFWSGLKGPILILAMQAEKR